MVFVVCALTIWCETQFGGAPALALVPSTTSSTTPPVLGTGASGTTTCLVKNRDPLDFCWSIETLDAPTRAAMTPSAWRRGCPVSLNELRRVRVAHHTFGGGAAVGELIVHRREADRVRRVLQALFDAKYSIQSMLPIERFGGDDDRSTMANNSSAFNCRNASGSGRYSEHAYGRAIDLNPVQNPYVRRDGSVLDPAARPFVDRAATAGQPGVITADGPVVRAFANVGWKWGGVWKTVKDYQHFSSTGR